MSKKQDKLFITAGDKLTNYAHGIVELWNCGTIGLNNHAVKNIKVWGLVKFFAYFCDKVNIVTTTTQPTTSTSVGGGDPYSIL